MDGRDTLVRDLDLPPGYYTERSEVETYGFFRRRVREVVDRKRKQGRRSAR